MPEHFFQVANKALFNNYFLEKSIFAGAQLTIGVQLTIALPDNLRSSHQKVFFEIADPKYLRKVPGKASFMKCFVS